MQHSLSSLESELEHLAQALPGGDHAAATALAATHVGHVKEYIVQRQGKPPRAEILRLLELQRQLMELMQEYRQKAADGLAACRASSRAASAYARAGALE